jgi:hypothetical protein
VHKYQYLEQEPGSVGDTGSTAKTYPTMTKSAPTRGAFTPSFRYGTSLFILPGYRAFTTKWQSFGLIFLAKQPQETI